MTAWQHPADAFTEHLEIQDHFILHDPVGHTHTHTHTLSWSILATVILIDWKKKSQTLSSPRGALQLRVSPAIPQCARNFIN